VAQELPTDETLLEKGVALFAQGQYPGAKEALENFLALYPSNTRATAYLDTIAANDLTIRRGITAYMEGNYRFAIQELKEAALRNRGSPRLYAFLATAYAAAYLLSGNTERSFRELAAESYRTARALDATYVLDTNFISPRIVSMLNSR
jgi:tetratricopeptide (TPR) repeat protein